MRLSRDFIDLLYRIPVLLLSFMIHELSHAVAALWCGDTTAKDAGRITLNPLRHIDPLGALMLIVARFGWAKPVPINPNNFRSPKRGIVLTSLAGPLSNVLLAIVFTVAYMGVYAAYFNVYVAANSLPDIALNLFFEFLIVNVSLAAFNLIPIPPLDGSKILFSVLPTRIYHRYILPYERFGVILIMGLSFSGLLSRLLDPMVSGLLWVASGVARFVLSF